MIIELTTEAQKNALLFLERVPLTGIREAAALITLAQMLNTSYEEPKQSEEVRG